MPTKNMTAIAALVLAFTIVGGPVAAQSVDADVDTSDGGAGGDADAGLGGTTASTDTGSDGDTTSASADVGSGDTSGSADVGSDGGSATASADAGDGETDGSADLNADDVSRTVDADLATGETDAADRGDVRVTSEDREVDAGLNVNVADLDGDAPLAQLDVNGDGLVDAADDLDGSGIVDSADIEAAGGEADASGPARPEAMRLGDLSDAEIRDRVRGLKAEELAELRRECEALVTGGTARSQAISACQTVLEM